MKKKMIIALMAVTLLLFASLAGCSTDTGNGGNGGDIGNIENSDDSGNGNVGDGGNSDNDNGSQVGDEKIDVTFVENGTGTGDVLAVSLFDNTSTEFLLNRLPSGNFPCDFDDGRTFAFHSSSSLRSCPENQEEVTSVKAGEIYLASGGQLRFYLEDIDNVSYRMTKIGYIENMDGFDSAFDAADSYAHSSAMSSWGNDIYFRIAKS